ncbi:MAG: hypothetical protein HY521_12500 [Proteobacteria bacterium]|nr:hypothetical protein [Pseudomonadota bacterium]
MRTTFRVLLVLSLAVPALAPAVPAQAQSKGRETELIGRFDDWNAFSFRENGKLVCYAASEPKKQEGNYSKRDDPFAMVTHRPGEKSRDVVSLYAGYPFQDKSEATVSIDGNDLALFTSADAAWAKTEADDRTLVLRMIKGREMVMKGTSSRGTPTTDTYSLAGFTAAYQAIGRACNVKPLG